MRDMPADTVKTYKAIKADIPDPVTITKTEYIFVPINDTVRVKDTLYLYLPRESKTYQTKDYRAVVSGYKPSLDSLTLRIPTTTITKTLTTCVNPYSRWGLSLSVGASLSADGKIRPALTAGLSYNLVRFRKPKSYCR